MKKLIVLLLISSAAFAQQQANKKHNFEDFNLIADIGEQERYYNEMIRQSLPGKLKPEVDNECRAQLAIGWLTKGDIGRYEHYMRTNPKFSVIKLVDLTYTLEYMVDEDKHIKVVEQASRDLLEKLEKGVLSDGVGRTQVLLEVNALANARLGNVDLAMKNIARSGEQKDNTREMKYFKDSKSKYLTRYCLILSAAGENKRALDTLTKAIRNADSNPKMVAVYKDIYKKVHGSTKGVDELIKSLQEKAYQDYYKEVEKTYIAKETKTITGEFPDPSGSGEMLTLFNADKPVKDIALTNLAEQEVKFADHAGKILVLDFWSTGCTPCVAAFSGFERVVADYKTEPFQLYVVNLFEALPTVEVFVARRGITLDVLRDEPNTAFNIMGTPTKIIYDPMGNIRFYALGYAGSTDREYYKLKAMVEIVKARNAVAKNNQNR